MLPLDAPSSDHDAIVTLGDVIIIGGGCYGTFYVQQLERARARGKASYRRLMVVDRNADCQLGHLSHPDAQREIVVAEWDDFLDRYLGECTGESAQWNGENADDVIVPSPLMPHLMYDWLMRRARLRWPERLLESRPIKASPRTPYDATAPDYTRYLSFADWICPTHCVEPALCPVIRGPRTWEMSEALESLTRRLDQFTPTGGPILFQCRHTVFAVGTFSIASVIAGDRRIAELGASGDPVDIVVGTISSCHGAVNLMHLGALGNR
jgi:hypothetical protein